MNKKIIILGLIIILIISGIFYFLRRPEEIVYTDEPETWVETTGIGIKQINVDKITRGTGYDGDDQLYLTINGTRTAFPYEGYYKGEYFEIKEIQQDGLIKMEVDSTFDIDDGIIEGYIVERYLNDTFEIFIFLDEDWKKEIPITNIIWGKDYSKTKQFIFNEVERGVYMDKIIDDARRFDYNYLQSNTGIIVGDATQEQVLKGVTEGVTVIIFQ